MKDHMDGINAKAKLAAKKIRDKNGREFKP
jgi:hypothetical protein